MRRREFLTLLGGAAAWPLAARAQQSERMRRIGALMNLASDDPESQARNAALLQRLGELGWIVGRNVRIDYCWGAGDTDRYRTCAAELVALAPDVILANGGAVVRALQQATRTVSIVFVGVTDPVGGGLVASLARPGASATGFTTYEYSTSGKWLELLKEIAPRVRRAGVIRDPTSVAGTAEFAAIQAVASSFGVEVSPFDARDAGEIERGITAFASGSNGGLIVPTSGVATVHRELIIAMAAQRRLSIVIYVPNSAQE
jgi:putative tryptophan/tyrosine transport system substrate-binding protein